MKNVLLSVALLGLVASGANAALLELLTVDGGGKLDLAPGGTAEMSIVLTIRDIDVLGFAAANVWLDDDNNSENGEVNVTAFTKELVGTYDDSDFTLPADISYDVHNEYSMIFEYLDGSYGPGTYTLTTLTLRHDGTSESGEVPVTFELGARAPQIFTPNNESLYVWGVGFDNVIPHFADPGVGGTNNPFIINFGPEPGTMVLLALGGLAVRRRHG